MGSCPDTNLLVTHQAEKIWFSNDRPTGGIKFEFIQIMCKH